MSEIVLNREVVLNNLELFFEKQINQGLVLDWGIKPVGETPYATKLQKWISNGYHANMNFMKKGLKERLNPKEVQSWAESVLIFSIPYPADFASKNVVQNNVETFKLARYAVGLDYHYRSDAITRELELFLKARHPHLKCYSFSDSKPIFERDWASEIGLGWRGKNTCTISSKYGSSFLLGGVLLNISLEKIKTAQDHCGKCRRCLDACPTQAFISEGVLNSNRCISYWTIEEKGEIPLELSQYFGEWIFGCDICQEVCPWNEKGRKKRPKQVSKEFNLSLNQWISVLKKGGGFQSQFKNTPLLRAGRRKLLRNLMIAIRNLSLKPKLEDVLIFIEQEEEGWVKDEVSKTITFLRS